MLTKLQSLYEQLWVRQAVLQRAIPFKIYRDVPSAGTTVSVEQRRAAMQEIRDLLADVDGNSIDLDQMKAERQTAKLERND